MAIARIGFETPVESPIPLTQVEPYAIANWSLQSYIKVAIPIEVPEDGGREKATINNCAYWANETR